MKIRFHGQEVRVRLGLSEVAALCDGRQVQTQLRLGPVPSAQLSFIVRPARVSMLEAHFTGGNLLLQVPETLLHGWLDDTREGFERRQHIVGDTTLLLKLEKDYACMHPKEDDSSHENTFEWARLDVTAMPPALNPDGTQDD